MSTLYEDTPLHIDASTNIRLLEIIQADDETAPIACTLRVIALQESPKYTALSYVWGPPTPAKDILYAKTFGTSCIKQGKIGGLALSG
ncbi:hypothetical protein J4E86_002980 [Alternaria arbusti]|uniref:uncharacterized protein n=1 Tax=Alternaria arbusti TaxID=232088 RepID=UPI0022208CEC|nr:uncharacterized protein J4E86_002980 [Alternaria arbusti]KAI4959258.1 hypothetical protein J4E86_002980 [Alternaria arbusti]